MLNLITVVFQNLSVVAGLKSRWEFVRFDSMFNLLGRGCHVELSVTEVVLFVVHLLDGGSLEVDVRLCIKVVR